MEENKLYDLIILGGGPAGATAALYGARAGLSVVVIEQMALGGEICATDRLDNFPAFPDGINGAEFGMLLQKQLENLEVPIYFGRIEKAMLEEDIKSVQTSAGEFTGKTALIATGTEPNLLNIEGELSLRGRGVSYCATCDAAFFRGKTIAVVGGGDAALEETIFLTRFAEKIYLIHRRDKFRGCTWLQDKVLNIPSVEILWNTTVSEIKGENKVNGIKIKQDGKDRDLAIDGIFIYAGRKPNAAFLENLDINCDDRGFIITSSKMETSVPGVYAAGDIRKTFLRQVITAAADGAIAATAVVQKLFTY
ncbi:MAG: NAD(P)/FAD-dependent oxidoreductase [Dethiobacteria bacterium]|nr:FAD-dependent oxidoreductase [Bacillota bacterium]MDW7730233.1 FAD-dependent oxidoreductase [Bacillota bacterium]